MAQVHAMPNGHLNKHEGGRKGKPVGIWGTRPLQRFIPHGGRKTNNNDTTKTANMYALLILRIVFARAAEMGAGAGSCPMVSVASCGCGATGTCGGGASGGARDATGAATGEVVTGTCVADATASSGTDAVPAGRPSTTRGLAVRAAFGLRTPEAERAVPERGRGTEGRRGAPPPPVLALGVVERPPGGLKLGLENLEFGCGIRLDMKGATWGRGDVGKRESCSGRALGSARLKSGSNKCPKQTGSTWGRHRGSLGIRPYPPFGTSAHRCAGPPMRCAGEPNTPAAPVHVDECHSKYVPTPSTKAPCVAHFAGNNSNPPFLLKTLGDGNVEGSLEGSWQNVPGNGWEWRLGWR